MNRQPTILHDPTSERAPVTKARLAPPASLDGKVIALLDLGKLRSDEFLDGVERELLARGHRVARFAKPTNAKPAPPELVQRIVSEADLVVEALAD